jgi:hypothetical protein
MLISISPSISPNPSLILDHRNTLTLHMHINKGKFMVATSVGRRTLSLRRHRIHRLRKHRILNSNLISNTNNHRHNNLLSIRPEYMPNNHSRSCSHKLSNNNLKMLVRPTFSIQMQHTRIRTLKHGRNTMRRVGQILLGQYTLSRCQA